MEHNEKINKSSWTLLEGIKDVLRENVANAVRGGQLKVEASQVERLLLIIDASADEGYHRSHKNFMRSVTNTLTELTRDVEISEASKKK